MRQLAVIVVALLGLSSIAVGTATANDEDVIRSGGCSGNSNWKLKLSPEDGGTEVEFEVDQNKSGQTWHVTMKRNGNRIFSGTRTTNQRSGSFEARKVVSQSHGDFTARGHNPDTDEVCRGRASI